jgi:hypothetical protein
MSRAYGNSWGRRQQKQAQMMHLTLFVPWVCLFFFIFFNMLTNDLILAQGGLMTTVGGGSTKNRHK